MRKCFAIGPGKAYGFTALNKNFMKYNGLNKQILWTLHGKKRLDIKRFDRVIRNEKFSNDNPPISQTSMNPFFCVIG